MFVGVADGVFKECPCRFFLVKYLWGRLHFCIFSTGPKNRDGPMENLEFENFFGSSVVIHDEKAVSCAYREQPKGQPYQKEESTMGKNIFTLSSSFIFACNSVFLCEKRELKKWYFDTKIVLTYCEKIFLKFETEGQEFEKNLRSLEEFIQTVTGQNNFW